MAANYAVINNIGKLETDFQQVRFVQIFLNFDNIVLKQQ